MTLKWWTERQEGSNSSLKTAARVFWCCTELKPSGVLPSPPVLTVDPSLEDSERRGDVTAGRVFVYCALGSLLECNWFWGTQLTTLTAWGLGMLRSAQGAVQTQPPLADYSLPEGISSGSWLHWVGSASSREETLVGFYFRVPLRLEV